MALSGGYSPPRGGQPCDTESGVQSAFVIVVLVVGAVGVAGAVLSLLLHGRTWDSYGRDRLLMESELTREAAQVATPAALAERDAEVRQMLEARNARRRRRGEAPLDVDAELTRLTSRGADAAPPSPGAPGVDEALRDEIRQLVVARNHRRARRGQPPLDVEAEVARQLGELGR